MSTTSNQGGSSLHPASKKSKATSKSSSEFASAIMDSSQLPSESLVEEKDISKALQEEIDNLHSETNMELQMERLSLSGPSSHPPKDVKKKTKAPAKGIVKTPLSSAVGDLQQFPKNVSFASSKPPFRPYNPQSPSSFIPDQANWGSPHLDSDGMRKNFYSSQDRGETAPFMSSAGPFDGVASFFEGPYQIPDALENVLVKGQKDTGGLLKKEKERWLKDNWDFLVKPPEWLEIEHFVAVLPENLSNRQKGTRISQANRNLILSREFEKASSDNKWEAYIEAADNLLMDTEPGLMEGKLTNMPLIGDVGDLLGGVLSVAKTLEAVLRSASDIMASNKANMVEFETALHLGLSKLETMFTTYAQKTSVEAGNAFKGTSAASDISKPSLGGSSIVPLYSQTEDVSEETDDQLTRLGFEWGER